MIHTQLADTSIKRKIESHAGNWGLFYENVADAILNGAELAVKPEHVINQIKVIEAAFLSTQTGNAVSLR